MKQGIASLKKFAKQGGVLNYLGKQKTVNAPIKWKSSSKHPVAFLSYITKEEMDILIKANIYGSLKGKANKGPFGLPSLQGSGSGSGGAGSDGGGSAAGGPGGSEGFDSQSGPSGPSGPGGSEGFDSQTGPSGVSSIGAGMGGFDDFGSPTAQSIASFEAAQAQQQAQEEEEQSPKSARLSPIGIAAYNMSLMNPEKSFTDKAIGFAFSPVSTLAATAFDSFARGARGPDDYSQAQTSVQTFSNAPSTDTSNDLPYPFSNQNTQKSGVATLF